MENFIARQPIFTSDKSLFGYELLYRNSARNFYPADLSGDEATRRVIFNALFTFDLESLTKGKMAFVNFTRALLLGKVPELLNPQSFAIEILESVTLDRPLLYVLQKYKEAGFTLILDDYTGAGIPLEYLSLLDIVKVDFLATDRKRQEVIARELKPLHITLLAEKIENKEDFEAGQSFGYTLFQGYYFSKPAVLGKSALSISTFSYARLIEEVTRPEMDFKKVADIIYLDVQLTWLLLKKMRTTEYYRGHVVSSIHLALVRMGTNEVRRWVMLLLLQDVLGQEMDEVIRVSLIRAVFCECLSAALPLKLQQASFSAGMFSTIASRDESFYQAFSRFEIGGALVAALKGENELAHCIDLARAYEAADWTLVSFLLGKYFPDLDSHDLTTMYMAAVNYADSALSLK